MLYEDKWDNPGSCVQPTWLHTFKNDVINIFANQCGIFVAWKMENFAPCTNFNYLAQPNPRHTGGAYLKNIDTKKCGSNVPFACLYFLTEFCTMIRQIFMPMKVIPNAKKKSEVQSN